MSRFKPWVPALAFLSAYFVAAPVARGLGPPDASLLVLPNASSSPRVEQRKAIARVWKGRTLASKADEYEKYLNASGIAKIRSTPGNRGVTLLRRADGDKTEFVVISIWESIEAIQRFAGKDYSKAVILARDREYLVEVEPNVLHYEIEREERKR